MEKHQESETATRFDTLLNAMAHGEPPSSALMEALEFALMSPPLTEAQRQAAVEAAMAEHSRHTGKSYANDWRIPISAVVLAAIEAIWGVDKAPLDP